MEYILKKVVVVLGSLFLVACSATPDINEEVFAYSKFSKLICSGEGFLECLSLSSHQCKGIVLMASGTCKENAIQDTRNIKDKNNREKVAAQKHATCLLKSQVDMSSKLGNKVDLECVTKELKTWVINPST